MKKKILLKAPLLTRSGYGEQSRFALRALRSREDLFDIYVQPLQWGKTSWVSLVDDERKWIDQTIEKTIAYLQSGGHFDMSLQVSIPNEWEKIAPVNVGYTAGIETTKVAHQWIQKGNEMDRIIVVSDHSKNTFQETEYTAINKNDQSQQFKIKIDTQIDSVNYPAKTFDTLPDLELELSTDINFLTVAQFGPRKNLPNTIRWFVEEFRDEDVGLVVKTSFAKNCLMDREKVFSELKKFLSTLGDHKCKVYLLHGDMEDDEMHSLYTHTQISALVALTHGEGFGLPIFEAAYSGLPVIATGWSGQLDFLVDENKAEHFYNVAFDINPVPPEVVWDGVLVKESGWSYPREESAKAKMRNCYEDILSNEKDTFVANAESYAESVQARFAESKQNSLFVESLLDYVSTEEERQWQGIIDQVVEYD